MPLCNCSLCGNVYQKVYSDICHPCSKQNDAILCKIIEYVSTSEKENFLLESISAELNIDINIVKYLNKKGDLIQIKNKLLFTCRKCNEEFQPTCHKLEFCPNCQQNTYNSVYKEKESLNKSNLLSQLENSIKSKAAAKKRKDSDHDYGFKNSNS